jgi:hypothetical protein
VNERLPEHVREEVQRILDAAARELLAARLNGDPAGPATGSDSHPVDDGTDEGALLLERKHGPVAARVDRHRRRGGRPQLG